jgi:hypothetical protein
MAPGTGAHEIVPVLPFCAVLAGRLLGGRLASLRLEPVLAAGLVVMLAALAYNDLQPQAAPQQSSLAAWLQAHNLRSGLAGYWEAEITTLDSEGHVRLAPLSDGGATAMRWESSSGWYNPPAHADFIVSYSASHDPSPVTPSAVRVRYGTPTRVYHFEDYTIMKYDHNLLTRVTVPPGSP